MSDVRLLFQPLLYDTILEMEIKRPRQWKITQLADHFILACDIMYGLLSFAIIFHLKIISI